MAALIRDAVGAPLSRNENVRHRALAVAGHFASGQHDLAEQHDRELESVYAED